MKLQGQLEDLRDTGMIEIVLRCFAVAARKAFGMMMCLTGTQRRFAGTENMCQDIQFQGVKMPAVLMRLQFAIVRVSIFGMIMGEHPEAEMERP